MNQPAQSLSAPGLLSSAAASPAARDRNLWRKIELTGVAVVLLGLNWPLLHGVCNSRLIFMPEAATHGEWWRWFTHPFIHVTWFHLLLDGAAFLMLYHDLLEEPRVQRLLFCIGSAVGSLVVCCGADPMLATNGLCGISAIAHGLMAVSALNLMGQRHDKVLFRIGIFSFVLVTAKCLIEVVTGKMLLTFLYFGMVGDPIAVTHAGGVLGALVTWLLCRRSPRA
jgi:membrane associated rhomboid family serine protease